MLMLKKYENFVGKLIDATSKQILPWNKTSRENEYEAVIGNNTVSIKYHPKTGKDQEGEYVSFILWDRFGDIVSELRACPPSSDYTTLYSLYNSAWIVSSRAEGTLDELIADISKIC